MSHPPPSRCMTGLLALALLSISGAAFANTVHGVVARATTPIAQVFGQGAPVLGAAPESVAMLSPESGAWRDPGTTSALAARQVGPFRGLDGSAGVEYRGRRNDTASDNDLYLNTDLALEGLIPDHARMVLTMRNDLDLDGGARRGSRFLSLDDTKKNDHVNLYRLYADLYTPELPGASLRLGRQWLPEFENYHADGASLRLPLARGLGLTAFAGRTVSFYSDDSGDWGGGAALTYALSPLHRFRLSYLYTDDAEQRVDNHAVSLETWLALTDALAFQGRLRTLDGDVRDLRTTLSWRADPLASTFYLETFHLFTTLGAQANHHSPFVRAGLADWERHHRLTLRSQTTLSPWASLGASATWQDVAGSRDRIEEYSNPDMRRFELSLLLQPHAAVDFLLAGHYWDADLRDDSWGLRGEVTYRPTPALALALGMEYRDLVFGWYAPSVFGEFSGPNETARVYQRAHEVLLYHAALRYRLTPQDLLHLRLELEHATRWENDPYMSIHARYSRYF